LSGIECSCGASKADLSKRRPWAVDGGSFISIHLISTLE
jgi:hypothetical protein